MRPGWRPLHDALTEQLIADGADFLVDPAWRAAWDASPRHLFIPDDVWLKDGAAYRAVSAGDAGFDWLQLVYSDQYVTVQVDDGQTEHAPGAVGARATSSASEPALVARMLHLAELKPGQRVLEVGAGVGWSSSITAAYVGDAGVVAVEIDPALAVGAAARARRAGRSHLIATGDGLAGWPRRAPFDRIVLTCAVAKVPAELIAQTAPGGMLLVPYSSSGYGGAMALLTADGHGGAAGPFVAEAHMMQSRSQRVGYVPLSREPVRERTSELPVEAFDSWPARTLLELAIPDLVAQPPRRRADGWLWMTVRTPDGSKASAAVLPPPGEATDSTYDVYEYGPRRLWAELEDAWSTWLSAGRPALQDHVLAVDADGRHRVVTQKGETVASGVPAMTAPVA